MTMGDDVDVLVIGGGMAALCTAISAREAGASVLLAEAAPRVLRGGNTRHSRNLRICHDTPTPLIPGAYPEGEFLAELASASEGRADLALAQLFVRGSASLPDWLAARGTVFQSEHIPYSRKTAFFLGGGKTAINALYDCAERIGVRVLYGQKVDAVDAAPPSAFQCLTETQKSTHSLFYRNSGRKTGFHFSWNCSSAGPFRARAIVACSGGAQADSAAKGYINRGTPFAKGEVLRSLLSQGAGAVGSADAAHLVAVDGRFTEPDGGIITRVDGMEHGIVVDHRGSRFLDETTIRGQTRYASWGRVVAALPERRATLILDRDGIMHIPIFAFPPIRADSLVELAGALALDACALAKSAAESGRVANPPFFAFPIRPGITFTCQGVKVDGKARVVSRDGAPMPGLFAAGMIMAPNLLNIGYLAGAGMSIGAVFGRIAGEEAARHALG